MRLVLFAAIVCSLADSALAAPADFHFEAVQSEVKASADSLVTVRLLHAPDNQPVKDAVIFASRMEMPMAGMAPMGTKLSPLAGERPGEYRFKADLSMAGPWTLTLSAKVQGETGTVTGTLPLVAKP